MYYAVYVNRYDDKGFVQASGLHSSMEKAMKDLVFLIKIHMHKEPDKALTYDYKINDTLL